MTTIVWFKDPRILMNKKYINELWPNKKQSKQQKVNAISRLIFLLTVLGFLITMNYKIVLLGIIVLIVIVLLYNYNLKNSTENQNKYKLKQKEGFTSDNSYLKNKNNFTNPNSKNPAMNVLLPQITYDPKRKEAAPAYLPNVEKQINNCTQKFVDNSLGGDDIKEKIFSSLGDKFDFEVGAMNRFYATPSTTIPNDQGAFADFCYGSMSSCKEGNPFACDNDPPRIGAVLN